MKDESMLKSPICFLRENQCPKCGKLLQLVDIDLTVHAIDNDGRILSGINDSKSSTNFFLYCHNCKTKYQTEKHGQFVRIKKAKIQPLLIENPFYKND